MELKKKYTKQYKGKKIILTQPLKKNMASSFQTKIKNYYSQKGYTVLKVIKLSANGYPDLYCFKKGYTDIWIESKEIHDRLSEIQKLRIYELNQQGKIAFCLQKGKGIINGNTEFQKDFELW